MFVVEPCITDALTNASIVGLVSMFIGIVPLGMA
jgi:hypothetical protein